MKTVSITKTIGDLSITLQQEVNLDAYTDEALETLVQNAVDRIDRLQVAHAKVVANSRSEA